MAKSGGKSFRKNEKTIVIISAITVFFALVFLYFFKYYHRNLSSSDFNIFLTGNLLNLVFSTVLTALLFYYAFSKKKKFDFKLLIINLIIMFSFLLIGVVSTYLPENENSAYLFDHPVNEVITAFFFSAYQFMQFFIITLFWNTIWGRTSVLILRSIVQSLGIIAFLYVFAFFYSYSTENLRETGAKEGNKTAIVLGAAVWKNNVPSPSLAGRVEKAVELYKKGIVNKIIFTGSNAPGELSESETALRYAKKLDSTIANTFIENNTTSTGEQIEFIKGYCKENRNNEGILIISDVYHLPRINEIGKFYNIKFLLQPSDLELSLEKKLFYKFRESTALLIFWFFSL